MRFTRWFILLNQMRAVQYASSDQAQGHQISGMAIKLINRIGIIFWCASFSLPWCFGFVTFWFPENHFVGGTSHPRQQPKPHGGLAFIDVWCFSEGKDPNTWRLFVTVLFCLWLVEGYGSTWGNSGVIKSHLEQKQDCVPTFLVCW